MKRWNVVVVYVTTRGTASSWSGVVQADDVDTAFRIGCIRARQNRPRLKSVCGGNARTEGLSEISWEMTHPVHFPSI